MISDANPYGTPDESQADLHEAARFDDWTNSRLLGLFFLPTIILIITFLAGISAKNPLILFLGLGAATILSVLVAGLSAYIHSSRQRAGSRTIILYGTVYLLAQAFAIILTLVGFRVILTGLLH